MTRPTIITCAVTGNITTPAQHPRLPITPEQIADACIGAAKAGAAIAHIHVRDPETGAPSMELLYYREVVERLRESGTGIIINLTTGPGGRFIPSEHDPKVAAPGSSLMPPEKRVEHIAALRPEICSLDLNTMYFGSSVVINTPRNVRIMAGIIRQAGVRPELEVFGPGDIQLGIDLIKSNDIETPALFQIVMGVKYSAPASPEGLTYLRSMLPPGSPWAAFGIGRWAFPMLAQAWLLGGHVRVGLEDNLFIEPGRLARDNAELVEKAARMIKDLGGSVATIAEAREILALPPERRPQ